MKPAIHPKCQLLIIKETISKNTTINNYAFEFSIWLHTDIWVLEHIDVTAKCSTMINVIKLQGTNNYFPEENWKLGNGTPHIVLLQVNHEYVNVNI